MTYTTHGHHIPFTYLDEHRPIFVEECGGVRMCPVCTLQASGYTPALRDVAKTRFSRRGEDMDFQALARHVVLNYVKDHLEKTDDTVVVLDDVYIVWFSKTLQNWKALVSTTLPDGMYYEVTHNGDKAETYLDAYKKFHNVTVAV